jgi:hypothetical protein
MGFQPPPWASQPSRVSSLEVDTLPVAAGNQNRKRVAAAVELLRRMTMRISILLQLHSQHETTVHLDWRTLKRL